MSVGEAPVPTTSIIASFNALSIVEGASEIRKSKPALSTSKGLKRLPKVSSSSSKPPPGGWMTYDLWLKLVESSPDSSMSASQAGPKQTPEGQMPSEYRRSSPSALSSGAGTNLETRANELALHPNGKRRIKIKDVAQVHGHVCEIPLNAYRRGNANSLVTPEDVEEASDHWEGIGILHDIDTQWGMIPGGGAYKESNHYYGPGEWDFY